MLLGSTIDPRLIVQDYSGIAKAGETQGQMYAQLGKDIGGAISNVSQMSQQNKQMQGQVDAASKGYESLAKAFPDQAEFFSTQAQGLNDPNTSLAEKIGALSSGSNMFGSFLQMNAAEQARRLAMMRFESSGGGGDPSRGGQ
tara:strand:+ start:2580 stop:3005 length:426 start_codon:yes stop_codon:yes gene_type:complete